MQLSSARFRIWLPFIGFLLLCGLWSGYWWWMMGQSQARYTEWRERLVMQDAAFACDGERWGGFPFRIELHCDKATLRKRNSSVAFTKLTLMAQAYQPNHILAVVDGTTSLSGPDGAVEITHEGAIASAILRENAGQLDVQFTQLASKDASASAFEFHARETEGQIDIATHIEGLTLRAPNEPGTLKLSRIGFDGKLTAQAGASPEGVLSLRIEDTAEFMRLLAGAESLGPEDQKAMEFVTGLLGGQDGGPLTLDFTARDGGLWYGPFRLTDLPRLE